jgi:predicted esterase
MNVLSIPTPTHGRVLVEDAASPSHSTRVILGCHGYAQNAATMLNDLNMIPGVDAWRRVSVQALNRFYTRGDESVVASWMTREDREDAIADNIQYLQNVVNAVAADAKTIVYLGFSQGASMVSRAAARVTPRAAGLIVLGGDIPAEVKDDPSAVMPPVLIGCGVRDTWYGARMDKDLAFLQSRGIAHDVVRFDGAHEFNAEFAAAVGRWLSRFTPAAG